MAAHFLLAIQDDLGFQILAQAFTGAQVLMREGTRQVMGTLSPGPATVPNRGRVVYRGVTYEAYSFNARSLPLGPVAHLAAVPGELNGLSRPTPGWFVIRSTSSIEVRPARTFSMPSSCRRRIP